MARLSMSELTTFRWSFEEDVAHYAACQIPAIGVWREKLADFGEEASGSVQNARILWRELKRALVTHRRVSLFPE